MSDSDGRIRSERFGHGRKKDVDHSHAYADWSGLAGSNPDIQANLMLIIRCLGNGYMIPEKFYRNGIDRDEDSLLKEHGIKHLHLHENTDVDALLFLIEYRDFILVLGIDGHRKHFEKPPGGLLVSLHYSAIANADAKAKKLAEAKSSAIRAGLLPRASVSGEAEPES